MDKLAKVRSRRKTREKELASLRRKEINLSIEGHLSRMPAHKALLSKLRESRRELHIVRLNLSRKKWSLKIRYDAIAKLRQLLQDYRDKEIQQAKILRDLTLKMQQLRRAAAQLAHQSSKR